MIDKKFLRTERKMRLEKSNKRLRVKAKSDRETKKIEREKGKKRKR